MFSIFIHEVFHVIHANQYTGSNAGKSICIDMNLKTHSDDKLQEGYFAAHTVLDVDKWDNVESFDSWRELSEKWAGFIENFVQVLLAALIGGGVVYNFFVK